MDIPNYLDRFKKAADLLDQKLLAEKEIEVVTGVYLNSVFLKLYKQSWASPLQDPVTAESRIFFSVWIDEDHVKTNELFYNIHALKLRKLKGYAIESRKFAADFRAAFKAHEQSWPNVGVDFGPLTLIQGTVKTDLTNLNAEILTLSYEFLKIAHLVDATLLRYKKG